ncbi:uncharacterized protein V6R79_018619 [Siganus canaliculatus]
MHPLYHSHVEVEKVNLEQTMYGQLCKRSLELDIELKQLLIKKAKLEVEKLLEEKKSSGSGIAKVSGDKQLVRNNVPTHTTGKTCSHLCFQLHNSAGEPLKTQDITYSEDCLVKKYRYRMLFGKGWVRDRPSVNKAFCAESTNPKANQHLKKSYTFCDNVWAGLHHSTHDFQDNRPAVNKLQRKRKSVEKTGQSSKKDLCQRPQTRVIRPAEETLPGVPVSLNICAAEQHPRPGVVRPTEETLPEDVPALHITVDVLHPAAVLTDSELISWLEGIEYRDQSGFGAPVITSAAVAPESDQNTALRPTEDLLSTIPTCLRIGDDNEQSLLNGLGLDSNIGGLTEINKLFGVKRLAAACSRSPQLQQVRTDLGRVC